MVLLYAYIYYVKTLQSLAFLGATMAERYLESANEQRNSGTCYQLLFERFVYMLNARLQQDKVSGVVINRIFLRGISFSKYLWRCIFLILRYFVKS